MHAISEVGVSPKSTGGMGTNYEYRVATVALAMLLSEGHMPFSVDLPLAQVCLQQRNAGYHLDDLVLMSPADRRVVVQAQVKKSLTVTGSSRELIDVLGQANRACEANAEAIARGEMMLGVIAEGNASHLAQLKDLTEMIRHLSDVGAVHQQIREKATGEPLRKRYRHVLTAMEAVVTGSPEAVEEAARRVLSALHVWIADAGPGGREERAALDSLREVTLPEGMYPAQLLGHIYEIATEYGPRAAQVDRDHLIRTIKKRTGVTIPVGRRRVHQAISGHQAIRQLPASSENFQGRERELQIMRDLAAEAADGDGYGRTLVISGRPGVGKTALAVQGAIGLRDRFSAAQLYADLRGTDESPADPADVLRGFLRAFGVADEEVPSALDEQAALFRSHTADIPMLILLDNAADAGQVRPLLPGPGPSLVLVTTRNAGLASIGGRFIPLEVLSPDECAELLAAATGRPEYRFDPRILRIAELCGHLPLALRIVSSILAGWGGWTPGYLIAGLEDQQGRLDRLEQEDLGVRASFELSYRRLKASGREMFRRLSAIPDSQFPAGLAAEAAGCDPRQATSLVETLISANLIDRGTGDGDIRLHDLIRVYAREKLKTEEGDAGTWAAEKRVLEGVLQRLNATTKALGDHTRYGPAEMGRMAGRVDKRWSLVRATLNLATERKAYPALLLTLGNLQRYIEMRGLWPAWADLGATLARAVDRDQDMGPDLRTLLRQASLEMIATGRAWMHDIAGAQAAASSLEGLLPEIEEPVLRATALNVIGNVIRDIDGDRALACYEQARSICREVGLADKAATATHNVANIYRDRGQYAEAITGYEEELAYRRSAGDRWEEAVTLTSLVIAYARVGRIDDAIAAHSTAAEIFEAVGDAANMSACHHDLGLSLVTAGRFDEGIAYLQQDLDIEVKRGNRRGASQSLAALGYSFLVAGREGADAHLREAIKISREIDDPGITAYASAIRLIMLVPDGGTDQLAAVESTLTIVKEHLGPHVHAELKRLCGRTDSIPLKDRIRHLEDAIAAFDRLGDTQDGDAAREELQDLKHGPGGSSVSASA